MDHHYKIRSNRESGDGRYDISLIPREKNYPGFILELKWKKGLDQTALNNLAEEALQQISDKKYETELLMEGVENIFQLGIAFSGKNITIKTK